MGNTIKLPRLQERVTARATSTANLVDPTKAGNRRRERGAQYKALGDAAANALNTYGKWKDKAAKAAKKMQGSTLEDNIQITSLKIEDDLRKSNISGNKWGEEYEKRMKAAKEGFNNQVADAKYSNDSKYDALSSADVDAQTTEQIAKTLHRVNTKGAEVFGVQVKENAKKTEGKARVQATVNPENYETYMGHAKQYTDLLVQTGAISGEGTRAYEAQVKKFETLVADGAADGLLNKTMNGEYNPRANEAFINKLSGSMSGDTGAKLYKTLMEARNAYTNRHYSNGQKERTLRKQAEDDRSAEKAHQITAEIVALEGQMETDGKIPGFKPGSSMTKANKVAVYQKHLAQLGMSNTIMGTDLAKVNKVLNATKDNISVYEFKKKYLEGAYSTPTAARNEITKKLTANELTYKSAAKLFDLVKQTSDDDKGVQTYAQVQSSALKALRLYTRFDASEEGFMTRYRSMKDPKDVMAYRRALEVEQELREALPALPNKGWNNPEKVKALTQDIISKKFSSHIEQLSKLRHNLTNDYLVTPEQIQRARIATEYEWNKTGNVANLRDNTAQIQEAERFLGLLKARQAGEAQYTTKKVYNQMFGAAQEIPMRAGAEAGETEITNIFGNQPVTPYTKEASEEIRQQVGE